MAAGRRSGPNMSPRSAPERTGRPVSLNREAKRIVEGLRTPGLPAEQLLEVLTCCFGDGREIARKKWVGVVMGGRPLRSRVNPGEFGRCGLRSCVRPLCAVR